jgi:hypothetical protein
MLHLKYDKDISSVLIGISVVKSVVNFLLIHYFMQIIMTYF